MFVEIKTKPVIWPSCYYQHSCFSGLNKSPVIRLFFKELNTIQSPHQNQPPTFWIHFLHNFTGLVKMTSGETDLQVRKAKHMTEYFAVKLIVNILLINREWDHYRKISDRGLDVLTWWKWGQHIKAVLWDFPIMNKQTRLISYYMAFSLWTWAFNQLKPTTGQRITSKNTSPQWVVHLSLRYSQVTLVSEYPFWQLSIDHNMDVHKDVQYQIKHRLYMPWTSS